MISQRLWSRLAAGVLGLALLVANVSADYSAQYCSSLNTADTNRNSSIYQSNGLCHDFCISSYAFAVVQSDGCWCSNYVPGTTTTGCTQKCPGYPSELCGASGLFGYIALTKPPSGTKGATSSSAPVVTPTPVSSPPTLIQMTVTAPGATSPGVTLVSIVTVTPPSASDSPTTPTTQQTVASPSSKTSNSESSSSWTPTPIVSLETVTGQVRTVTVTPTAPPNSQNANDLSKDSGGGKRGLSTGAAVGLTVGLVAIIAIIAAMAWFCVYKRKQDKADEFANLSRSNSIQGALGGSPGSSIPTRTMSENSRYMLNTNGRQVVETWEPENAGKRQSRLQPVDQRLDPFAPLYQENRSRESVATLQDHVDYSRRVQQTHRPVLRVNNPDSD